LYLIHYFIYGKREKKEVYLVRKGTEVNVYVAVLSERASRMVS